MMAIFLYKTIIYNVLREGFEVSSAKRSFIQAVAHKKRVPLLKLFSI
jgi:hypothetical protein